MFELSDGDKVRLNEVFIPLLKEWQIEIERNYPRMHPSLKGNIIKRRIETLFNRVLNI